MTEQKPLTSPIHPTQRNAPHASNATMDGSTCDQPGYPHAWVVHVHGPDDLVPFNTREQAEQCAAAIHAATNPHSLVAVHPLDPIISAHVIPPQNMTEHATDARPVVSVVAHALDLDAIEAELEGFHGPTVRAALSLLAEVRRLNAERDVILDRLSDRTAGKWAAEDERDRLRTELSADRKAIGVLAAAVGKVSDLHQADEDGFCRACQTTLWPCATAKAIGAGQ